MTKVFLLVSLLSLASCGTMRLQVSAPYKSSQGNGHVTYERSYKVGGGMPLWCALTAVFYGGACWAYFGIPFVPDEVRAIKDAQTVLNTQLGATDAVLENPEVKRISWSSAETYFSLERPKTDPLNPVQ